MHDKIIFLSIFFTMVSCSLKKKEPIQIICKKQVQGTSQYYEVLNFEDDIESFKELDNFVFTRLKYEIIQFQKEHISVFYFGNENCVNIDKEDTFDAHSKSIIFYRFSTKYDEKSDSNLDSTLRDRQINILNISDKKILSIRQHEQKNAIVVLCFGRNKIMGSELANFIFTAESYSKENAKKLKDKKVLFFLLDENQKKVCQIIKKQNKINLNFYFL